MAFVTKYQRKDILLDVKMYFFKFIYLEGGGQGRNRKNFHPLVHSLNA